MIATPVDGFNLNPVHRPSDYVWIDLDPRGTPVLGTSMDTRPPDGGWFQVQFYPVGVPMDRGTLRPLSVDFDECQPLLGAAEGRLRPDGYYQSRVFISFNDAEWTTADQGYAIARNRTGVTRYMDKTSVDPLGDDPLLRRVKDFFKLTGQSRWFVVIGRTKDEVLR